MNESVIQENVRTNRDCDHPFKRRDRTDRNDLEHLIGAVGGERQGAAEYSDASQDRWPGEAGATSARRSRGENRRKDCAGMVSGAKPGIDPPSDEPGRSAQSPRA